MCRETCRMTHHQENKPRTKFKTPIQYRDLELCNVDYVSSNLLNLVAMLYIFKDK